MTNDWDLEDQTAVHGPIGEPVIEILDAADLTVIVTPTTAYVFDAQGRVRA